MLFVLGQNILLESSFYFLPPRYSMCSNAPLPWTKLDFLLALRRGSRNDITVKASILHSSSAQCNYASKICPTSQFAIFLTRLCVPAVC